MAVRGRRFRFGDQADLLRPDSIGFRVASEHVVDPRRGILLTADPSRGCRPSIRPERDVTPARSGLRVDVASSQLRSAFGR